MTDEPHRTTDATHLIDHWTRDLPGPPITPEVRPATVQDELERIAAERDARKGLHPPAASIRRVPQAPPRGH